MLRLACRRIACITLSDTPIRYRLVASPRRKACQPRQTTRCSSRSNSCSLADLDSYGVAFVSLKDNLDLSTPSGRLMFQIIGAMAEFERALCQERVRAGLKNARANGKTLGRPRVSVDATQIASLRASGTSWQRIADQMGIGVGTACRAFQTLPKTLEIQPV